MNLKKRKIAVFTGNRAEYGLQYPVLKALSQHPEIEYYLLVSGAHLKEDFGHTLKEIESDGFKIHAQIQINMPGDNLFSTAQAIGSGILNLSPVLNNLNPDFLVVYADRFEGFSALITGTQMGIPTAHIEGGDYTEGGALDDSVRHAMTKLAHIHFTTNEQAAERIKRMGEEHWRIFNVGMPVLDLVAEKKYADKNDIYKKYKLNPEKPILIFTQHSVTTEFEQATKQILPLLKALEECATEMNCQVIITYPNDDAGGKRIIHEIVKLAEKNNPLIQIHQSLGRYYYHGVLNVAAACIGNSSSGIKETPAFHCPCINIGNRQQGRLRGNNVIDVGYDKNELKQAVLKCLNNKEFKEQVCVCKNPYGAGNSGLRIAEVLATTEINKTLIQKQMTY